MSEYVRSKSKTGKTPRTGNRYKGSYHRLENGERIFLLVGVKSSKGELIVDTVAFNSAQAAMKAGWTKVA